MSMELVRAEWLWCGWAKSVLGVCRGRVGVVWVGEVGYLLGSGRGVSGIVWGGVSGGCDGVV